MTFSGASDNSDAANPKMTMTIAAEGQNTTVAMPGDGNMYMVTPSGTFGAPVPAVDRSKTAIDSAAIYAALGKAIGHFQTSQPMQNAHGQPVNTITAKVDRNKVCSKVLPAFGDLMSKASSGAGSAGLSALGAGNGGLGGICKIMLIGDPQVWFGIDPSGALTDVSLNANLAFPGVGAMTFALQYHEYDQGQPQPSIKTPPGAKMYPSLQALAPAATPSSPTATPASPAAYCASRPRDGPRPPTLRIDGASP
jgi:hypothetical protein